MKTKTFKSKLLPAAVTALFVLLSFSCHQPESSVYEPIIEERDSLLQAAADKDTIIHHLTSAVEEVERNLADITSKQNDLSVHAGTQGELVADKREEINRVIADINRLMDNNARKINALNEQVKRLKYNNTALNRMVDLLFEHIMYKNNDLAALNNLLRKRNASIAALNNMSASLNEYGKERVATIEKQDSTLASNDKAMNAGYYVLGTSQELKHMCVLDQGGKLMGGFNNSNFKSIDIRKEMYVPGDRLASGEIVKIMTPHPAASYELVKNDKGKAVNIRIKDQQAFWSRSKYLVVETH